MSSSRIFTSRIAAFPSAFEDELFWSVCARFARIVGFASKRMVVSHLLGTPNALAVVDLPSYLESLVNRLSPGHSYTVDRIIDQHTMLPFYAPFMPLERVRTVRHDMQQDRGRSIHMRTGIMPSRIKLPAYLRLCPECVEVDRSRYGECYWHRIHQLPSIQVCPIHSCMLLETTAPTRTTRLRQEFVCAEDALTAGLLIVHEPQCYADAEVMYSLAYDALWLFQQESMLLDQATIRMQYLRLLAECGLATYSGQVRAQKLVASFREYYGRELLRSLSCSVDGEFDNWVLRLLREGATQHPLYHLLMMHFLGHSVKTFFDLSVRWHPFGQGPWPCLNPLCEDYKRLKIRDHSIHYSAGRPVALFACNACGYTYSRTGPDSLASDIYRLSHVESFGTKWEGQLKELWSNPANSLRTIARSLVVDPSTVKHQIKRLSLPPRSLRWIPQSKKHLLD